MRVVHIQVAGRPQQRGSKQSFANPKGGKPLIVDMNKKSAPWMATVADAAFKAMNGTDLFAGPVRVKVSFFFKRPGKHYHKRKAGDVLRADAPRHHASQPDCDKLMRAIGDALTGVAMRDDAQIASMECGKFYTESSEGAEITVSELGAAP